MYNIYWVKSTTQHVHMHNIIINQEYDTSPFLIRESSVLVRMSTRSLDIASDHIRTRTTWTRGISKMSIVWYWDRIRRQIHVHVHTCRCWSSRLINWNIPGHCMGAQVLMYYMYLEVSVDDSSCSITQWRKWSGWCFTMQPLLSLASNVSGPIIFQTLPHTHPFHSGRFHTRTASPLAREQSWAVLSCFIFQGYLSRWIWK